MTRAARASSLAGVPQLVRFMARRDRLTGVLWVGGIVGLVVVSVASLVGLYTTDEDLQVYADLATTETAMKAMAGPGYGLDQATMGAVVMNEVLMFSFVGILLMAIFITIRHTRTEEEENRTELVRSLAIGRHSILVAAVTWVTMLNLVVAAGLVVSLVAFGLGLRGTLAYASACFGVGIVATAITAVSAQISTSARTARSGAGVVFGLAFVIRAIADVGVGAIVWLSPLGWAQSIRAFDDERWWVLAPLGLSAVVLMGAALSLASRRDFGGGMLTERPGRVRAHRWLRSPVGLAVRLQRTSLISWALAMAALGFLYGLLADQADDLLDNEVIAEMFAQAGSTTPSEAFISTTFLILALMTAGFTVSSVLRIRTEETPGGPTSPWLRRSGVGGGCGATCWFPSPGPSSSWRPLASPPVADMHCRPAIEASSWRSSLPA